MFRKALALALTVAVMTLAVPATMLAENPTLVGSVAGRAVDAAGRGVGSQRVELMQGGFVVSVGMTSAHGEWSFRDVKPGDYIVRMTLNGKVAGVRVSVTAGQAAAGTLIVVPTASVAPQIGSLASLVLSLAPTAATAVAATGFAQSVDTETTLPSEEVLMEILENLTPAQAVAFAEAIQEVIANNPDSPFAQYEEQLEIIVETGGNEVPFFPAPVIISG
jgi:hypothetical protein